jgi:glycosyltransferase involved in cell wall biosynthesis
LIFKNSTLTLLYYSPSNAVGGAEMSLKHTMTFMKSKGHRIILVLPPASTTAYISLVEGVVDAIYYVKGMNWIASKQKGIAKLKSWLYSSYKSGGWHLKPILRIYYIIIKENVQLVSSNTLTCIDAAFAAKISGRPHIQHIREVTGGSSNAIFKLKFQGTIFFRWLYRNLNFACICNSNYTLKESIPYFPEEKLQVIYNSVELPTKLPAKYLDGVMKICSMANLTARMKNHMFILKVANAIKRDGGEFHFEFNLFGNLPPDNDPYFKELKDFVKLNQLDQFVHFCGLGNTEIVLTENHVLIHPFSGESFGRIYIEAMSYGRPIVAVSGGGASELIKNKETGYLFNESEVEECSLALLNLRNSPGTYNQMAENGRQFSLSFTSNHLFDSLETVYKKAINSEL